MRALLGLTLVTIVSHAKADEEDGLQLGASESEPEEEAGPVGAWERLLNWVEGEHGVAVREGVEALEIATAGGAAAESEAELAELRARVKQLEAALTERQ